MSRLLPPGSCIPGDSFLFMTVFSGSGRDAALPLCGSDRYRQDADQKSWQRFTDYLDVMLR